MTASEERRRKKVLILDAAMRLLGERGLQALSFEAVATEAGLSRQLIRYYYPGSDELMVELCDHMGQIYQDALVKGIVKVGQVERLDFFLDFFFGVSEVEELPPNLQVYDAMFAYSVGCAELRDRMRAHYETLGKVIVHELAIAFPELGRSACGELSFLFVSAMHAHWSFVATMAYDPEHGRVARKAFDRVIASYRAANDVEPALDLPWRRGDG